MSDVRRIIVFLRPWEIPFLVGAARDLRLAGVGAKENIVYLTLWKMAAKWLDEARLDFEEVHFLGGEIAQATPSPADLARFQQMERTWVGEGLSPLKTMLDAERFRPGESSAQLDFLWRHLKVLDPLVGEGSLVLSQGVDHLCYWLACDLARHRGGRFVGFSCSGRPSGRTQVLRSPSELWLPRAASAPDREVVSEQRDELMGGLKPDFMYPKKSKVGAWGSLKYRAKLIEEMRAGNYFVRPSDLISMSRGPDLINQTRWQAAKRAMRPRALAEIQESFVYFPLHLEPEATTLVYCPTFNDQANAIDVIAKSLPSGVSLLIKENPKMWGKRPTRFYERANRNAGVMWAEGDAPSQEILERCEAVLTLTSTTALEATLLDKPVACFGRPPFVSALPSLPIIDSLGQLPQKVAGLLDRSGWPQADLLLEQYATYVANLLPTPFYGTSMEEGIPMPVIGAFEGVAPFVLECL